MIGRSHIYGSSVAAPAPALAPWGCRLAGAVVGIKISTSSPADTATVVEDQQPIRIFVQIVTLEEDLVEWPPLDGKALASRCGRCSRNESYV